MQLLLVVDDAPLPSRRLVELLRDARHTVRTAHARTEAELAVLAAGADAVVVDPDVAPRHAIQALRDRVAVVRVVAWLPTPSSTRVADLLEEGAHEVLHSGMSDRELAARVAATTSVDDGARVVESGALQIDQHAGEATWHGERLSLTPRERDVLRVLADAGGRTVRRETVYRAVWGYAMPRGDRTVDVNVKRLRTKLSTAAPGLVVETEPGVGYRIVTDL